MVLNLKVRFICVVVYYLINYMVWDFKIFSVLFVMIFINFFSYDKV